MTNIAGNSSVDSSSNTFIINIIKQETGVGFRSVLILLLLAVLFFIFLL